MNRVVGSILIVSLFLFILGLPLLHLHPATQYDHDALIHSHMPQTAGVHSFRSAPAPKAEGYESSEFECVPIDISALCPSGLSPVPIPEFSVLLAADLSIAPDLQGVCFRPPDPKAQAPPGVLIYHSLRSPPA